MVIRVVEASVYSNKCAAWVSHGFKSLAYLSICSIGQHYDNTATNYKSNKTTISRLI